MSLKKWISAIFNGFIFQTLRKFGGGGVINILEKSDHFWNY